MPENTVTSANTPRKYIPLSKWNTFHEYPPVATMRDLRFYNKGGFNEACVRQLGRRILIDEAAFFAWFNAQQKGAVS